MNLDFENIRNMCNKYVTEPKLLIVPAASLKGQVKKALLDENIFFANLFIETVEELAVSIAKPDVYNSNYTVIDINGMEEIVNDVMNELKLNSELEYFSSAQITVGLNRIIAETILEIKKAGFAFNKINFGLIKNERKRNDLKKIMLSYENALKNNKCLDLADVFLLALDRANNEFAAIYALTECEFSYLEKVLLEKLNYKFFDVDDSCYLDYRNVCKGLDNVYFKKIYGDNLEVKEIIRTIINNKIPFDKVLIVALNSEPYTQLLYQQLLGYVYGNDKLNGKNELPITFGTGITIAVSNPAKLLMTLLSWINGGYVAHDFVSIIASGAVKIKDKHISRNSIITAIKSSGITWQRHTYISVLQKFYEGMAQKGIEKRKAEIKWLIDLFENILFPNIPVQDEDGFVSVDEVVIGLKCIMNEICSITSAADKEGYNVILSELDKIIKGRKARWSDITEMISKRILDLRIFSSAPEAGKMHFTTYRGAQWVRREHTFFIGNDVLRFPSNINQNPILLDDEREEGLIKSKEIVEKNIKDMSRFLESVTGKLYASYAYFDTIQNRENYASFIFNALLEEIAKRSKSEKHKHENDVVKTINFALESDTEFIDETDYVLKKAAKHSFLKGITSYDMEFSKDISAIDLENIKFEFSPSSLMTYLSCRYKYYLKYILRLEAIVDREVDKLGWLSHLEVGKLYHEIFEKFENCVIEDNSLLDNMDNAKNKMEGLYNDILTKYEMNLPVASDFMTAIEKKAIYDNCIKFVENEVKFKDESVPLLTEYKFGEGNSCKLIINDEEVYINGIIDRVDMIKSNNKIKIIDYKTGSTYGYDILGKETENIINEKSIQPILYYFALKDIAKKDAKSIAFANIACAEYYFVTEKGNYDKVCIKFNEDTEERAIKGLSELINSIKSGDFFSCNTKLCEYCEYKECCDLRGVKSDE